MRRIRSSRETALLIPFAFDDPFWYRSVVNQRGPLASLCSALPPFRAGDPSGNAIQRPHATYWKQAIRGNHRMTRLREVPNFRELRRRDLLPLRDKLVFLDLQLLDFRVQRRSANSELRCRTYWASDFPVALS